MIMYQCGKCKGAGFFTSIVKGSHPTQYRISSYCPDCIGSGIVFIDPKVTAIESLLLARDGS